MLYDSLLFSLVGLILVVPAEVISYRLVYEHPLTPKLLCNNCQKKLNYCHSIPIVSYLLLRGKSSCCKKKIGAHHLIFELGGIAMFFSVHYYTHSTFGLLISAVVAFWLMVVIISDFYDYIIPDTAQIALLITGLYYSYMVEEEILYTLGKVAFISGLLFSLRYMFYRFYGKEALGLGDIKLMIAVALFLELEYMILVLFISGMLGIITHIVWKSLGGGNVYPFGPALAIGFFALLMEQMSRLHS